MIGLVVDGHEVLRPLGVGGMGEVYLARAADGSLRALKVVRTDREAPAHALARFRREVLLLGKLRHPGIVQIIDAGRLDTGGMYLAMEYVAGPDLQAAIGWDGPFAVRDALAILTQLAAALAYAHGQGIVHRDLKPPNVILADGDPARAKIIDFGLAKVMSDENLTRLTDDQDLLGSPLYWAPEQSSTPAVGPAADVYALGGLAYFLLTGEPVFRARPAVAMVYAHLHETPAPLGERCKDVVLPRGFAELIGACLAKTPDARPTAEQLVLALDRMLQVAPADARAKRAQRLFTMTGLSNLEQAVTSQIRQVLVDLAAVIGHSTDHLDRVQNELSEIEIDLAMLESELQTSPDATLEARRDTLASTVAELQSAIADGYRELYDQVTADRTRAPADATPLFRELDGLVDHYKNL